VIDAALIAAAQKVEHYEIASYGCLVTYANLLGQREVADLLKQNLAEEEKTDKALTALGEGGINEAAVAAGSRTEEE
jgi:ferritin-like metal-binding protein YciE